MGDDEYEITSCGKNSGGQMEYSIGYKKKDTDEIKKDIIEFCKKVIKSGQKNIGTDFFTIENFDEIEEELDKHFGQAEEDEEDEKNIKPTSTWTCKNEVEFKPFGMSVEDDTQSKVKLIPGQTVKAFNNQFIAFTINDNKNQLYRLPLIDFQDLVSNGLDLEEEVKGFEGGARRKTRKRKFNKKKSKRNRNKKTKNRNRKTKNRNRKNKNYSKKRN